MLDIIQTTFVQQNTIRLFIQTLILMNNKL